MVHGDSVWWGSDGTTATVAARDAVLYGGSPRPVEIVWRPAPSSAVSRQQVDGERRCSAPEQCQDGEHGAVVVRRVWPRKPLEDGLDAPLDPARAEVELAGDRAVGASFRDQRQHFTL